MSNIISLQMNYETLDCLNLAVSNLREDINSGELKLSEDMAEDFTTEIGQLEYLIAVGFEELENNAKSEA